MRGLAPIVLLLPAVLAVLPAARAAAQVDPLWDHYKVYEISPIPIFEPASVTLTDQFGQSSHVVGAMVRFMNPVEKVHGPLVHTIHDSITHYAWRNLIPPVNLGLMIAVINQFGDQTLHVLDNPYLVGPARKNPSSFPLPPVRNYYRAYNCQGSSVGVPVGMTDQFDTWPATALAPRYFLAPAVLQWGGATLPIVEVSQHYVCYEFQPSDPAQFTADVYDLWFGNTTSLGPSAMICVPTDKLGITPTHRDTWGRIKVLYR